MLRLMSTTFLLNVSVARVRYYFTIITDLAYLFFSLKLVFVLNYMGCNTPLDGAKVPTYSRQTSILFSFVIFWRGKKNQGVYLSH